jgi:multidrug efflux system membrane fusion protein
MRKRTAAILLVVLAVAGGGAYEASRPATDAAVAAKRHGAGDPVPVLTARAAVQDVPIYLDALGTVQAFNTVSIKAMIDGPLVEVRFREGQDVQAGDVLARIDARPTQASLDQYTAKKAQDDATLANARVDLARYQKLVASAYTSAQISDTQKATVAQTEALVRQDQAQIDNARTQLSYTTITAPITGRTGIRQVDQGNIVHSADTVPLTVITQLRPISVVFTLPQQALSAVAAAMQAGAAKVLALPQGQAADAKAAIDQGEVAVLDNQVDPNTGTIKLKATFPNPDLKLWPGGFINVRLLVQTEHDVVTVSPLAVQRGPRGAYVYVVKDDSTVSRRPVTVGHEDEAAAIVTAGLQADEQVVVDGASRLSDNAKVTIADPGAAPSAARTPGTSRHGQRASAAP